MNTLIIYVLLATISPMFAGIFPVLLQRKDGNFQGMTLALLGISAGMLFAVSTLDLIPEAVQFAASSVTEHFETEDEEILDHLEHEVRFFYLIFFFNISLFSYFSLQFSFKKISNNQKTKRKKKA